MKTEPTYEVNFEKLESLSIADLTGLMDYSACYRQHGWNELFIALQNELDKRINDIIIF